MKTHGKFLSVIGMTALLAAAVAAEDVVLSPTLTFGKYPLSIGRTTLLAHPGLPAGKAELDSPFPDDFPPHIEVMLEDTREYPALKKGARYFQPAKNRITVYRISEMEKAPYKSIQKDVALLKKLLKERPASVPHKEIASNLPDYPPRNAGHVFESRLSYIDAEWGSGLCYLTQFTQEPGHFANNEELMCVFQGLSKDGAFYISADLRVTHPGLPAGIDKEPKDGGTAGLELLNKAKDDTFTPSLGKIREWLGTIQLK